MYVELQGRNGSLRKVLQTGITCVFVCEVVILEGKGRQGEKVGEFSRGVKIEVQKRCWTANWYYVCVKVCLAYEDRVGGDYLRCK